MNINMGEIIEALRKNKNITQTELGKAIGVSSQAVSKWEAGGTPDIALIPLIADYFDVSIDYLFGRITPKDEENLHKLLRNAVALNKPGECFKPALEYCREILNGLYVSGRGIEPIQQLKHEGLSFISREDGFLFLRDSHEFDYFFLINEKENISNIYRDQKENIMGLFKSLGQSEYFDVFTFIHSRRSKSFTVAMISEKLEIPEEKIIEILTYFTKLHLVCEFKADDKDGEISIIRIHENPAAKVLFIIVLEIINKNFEIKTRSILRSKSYLE